jgi:xylulokinase
LARASVEGVICGLLDGLDALGRFAPVTTGRLVLVGGGARSAAFRNVLADLTGRAVHVPSASEHVAAGACVQAAAVLDQEDPTAIATRWNLGEGIEVAPSSAANQELARKIRSRYDRRRDAEAG